LAIKAVSQRINKAHFAPAKAYSRKKDKPEKLPKKRNAATPQTKKKARLITPN
jgi:hypothetical protein